MAHSITDERATQRPRDWIHSKILSVADIAPIARRLRREGKIVVQCHGTFDLLHIGHVRHLEAARALGDVLIVTLTADRFVNKGPGRPVFTELLRAEMLAALDCVSYVAVTEAADAIDGAHHKPGARSLPAVFLNAG